MLKLVVTVDGSESSLRAIDAAARLAKDADVEAVLLNVREGAATYHGDLTPREYERIGGQVRDKQSHILEDALAHARQAGLAKVTVQAESGTPDVDIPRVAAQCGADMIVMATRGLGAVGALLMGSVTQQVVHNAKVPVLLVK